MVAALLLDCGAGTTEPDTALLEQTDVFVAGQDGIAEYRIPVLVTSTQGTLSRIHHMGPDICFL